MRPSLQIRGVKSFSLKPCSVIRKTIELVGVEIYGKEDKIKGRFKKFLRMRVFIIFVLLKASCFALM